jgi:hypothetical protein
MNNRQEQDHHGIKQRYYPMPGFGSFAAAARFGRAHDELRDHFRCRQHLHETVSLADQRQLFGERWGKCARCCRPCSPASPSTTAGQPPATAQLRSRF